MSSEAVVVYKVQTKAEERAFFEFPWSLYQDDPHWVPPLLSIRRETLDRKHAPAWNYLDGEYFIAMRGKFIVGTIAAIINPRHDEFQGERVGWFGAFECNDDQEAATALLETAADWVRAKGYPVLRGPQTFTTHEETGLLVDGFTRPILLMPYNKPYYAALIEGAGFHAVMDTYSFHLGRDKVDSTGMFARLEKITNNIMRRNKITIRQVDRKNLNKDFALVKELYNAAWDANWGFVPMTERELDGLIKALVQFFDPELGFFAYVDGQPAGFVLGVPDFNQVLQKVYPRPGTPEIFSLLKILYYWKVAKIIDTARIPLLGVKKEYRGKGVDVAIYFYMLRSMLKANYKHSDSGWILASNDAMVSIAKNFGCDIYRTYRYYERALDITEPAQDAIEITAV